MKKSPPSTALNPPPEHSPRPPDTALADACRRLAQDWVNRAEMLNNYHKPEFGQRQDALIECAADLEALLKP